MSLTRYFIEGHFGAEAVGWALVHFVWQGALVALLYACAVSLMRSASAQARYLAGCAALALMLALPFATVLRELDGAKSSQPHASDARGVAVRGGYGFRERDEASSETNFAGGVAASEAEGARKARAGWRGWAAVRFERAAAWLVFAWMTGVLLLGLRACGGWFAVRRLRRSAQPVAEEFERIFSRAVARLKVARAVRLCRSALVEVPSVVGVLRPVVLVPASALTGLTPRQLEAVLAHELAHIRRYDFLVNLLQTAVETLLFYHPAVWWISSRMRDEREHACDDAAVAATGDPLLYARALTTLETLRRADGFTPALALASNGGSLMKRIRRIVGAEDAPAHTRSPLVAGALLFTILCGALTLAPSLSPLSVDAANDSPNAPAAKTDRKVAVTFVNFPGNTIQDNSRLVSKTRKLIRSLAAQQVAAVGFVNESKLYKTDGSPDEERVRLLREWLDAGHELGNETFRHTNLRLVSTAEFQADVERGEKIMSGLLAERGRRLRYFSYPYLNTGADAAQKSAVEKYLKGRGYRIHPVTIDNMDWLFNRAYLDALRAGDEATMTTVRAEYVAYMERMFEFYEGYSREVMGREFPQVLMLTGGALNADAFDELAAMLKGRGYSFVTMEEAVKDEAYKTPDAYAGGRGESWIARWAATKGKAQRDVEEERLGDYMQRYFAEFTEKQRAEKGKTK